LKFHNTSFFDFTESGIEPLPVKFYHYVSGNMTKKNFGGLDFGVLTDDYISFRRTTYEKALIRKATNKRWYARYSSSLLNNFNVSRGFMFAANFYNEEISEDYIDFYSNYSSNSDY